MLEPTELQQTETGIDKNQWGQIPYSVIKTKSSFFNSSFPVTSPYASRLDVGTCFKRDQAAA